MWTWPPCARATRMGGGGWAGASAEELRLRFVEIMEVSFAICERPSMMWKRDVCVRKSSGKSDRER